MTQLVVLGATGSFGARALASAPHRELDVTALVSKLANDEFLRLADTYTAGTLIVTGAAPAERHALIDRFGDRVGFDADSAFAAAAGAGATVVNGWTGLEGLAASAAALEAGNSVVVGDRALLARSGRILPEAAAKGGGDLVVDGPAWAVHRCASDHGITDPLRVVVVSDGGPLVAMAPEEVEGLDPNGLDGAAVGRAALIDAAFAAIGVHLLSDPAAISVGVDASSERGTLVSAGDSTWEHRPTNDALMGAIVDPDAASGTLVPLASVPSLEEPTGFGGRVVAAAAEAIGSSGAALTAFGAAADVGVRAFVDRRVGISVIPEIVERTIDAMPDDAMVTVDDVVAADREARELATSLLGGMC